MNDDQVEEVLLAAQALAITIRDEGPAAVRAAASDVIQAAGGDVVAALSVLAAMIPVDAPLEPWWRSYDGHKPADVPAVADGADPVVVDRLISGVPVRSNPVERAAAIDRLSYTRSAEEIAEALNVSSRTVVRARTRLRLVGAA